MTVIAETERLIIRTWVPKEDAERQHGGYELILDAFILHID